MGKIKIRESSAYIADLNIHSSSVMDYFRKVPPAELESAFTRALEVGAFCLERSGASQQVDFVKREMAAVLGAIEKSIGSLPGQVESALLQKIGTADGQVLAPLKAIVDGAVRASGERLADMRSLIGEMDPARENSVTGKVVRNLRDLLDPKRADSVQGSVEAAIRSVSAPHGALSKTVQAVVENALKSVTQELDQLAKEVRGRDAAREALNQTTVKGLRYEQEVVKLLQPWTRLTGAVVRHVGADNRPGDILVELTTPGCEAAMRVVIEVRDRRSSKGRNAVSAVLEEAISVRSANAGIYLSRSAEGLAQELGEWAEGDCGGGPFVICTHEHLTTALRFLHMRKRIAELQRSSAQLDGAAIHSQLLRIRTLLDRFRNISRRSNEIRSCTWEIDDEASSLRSEIREALTTIEDALRSKRGR